MKSSTYYNAAKKAELYNHKQLAQRFREAGDNAKKNETSDFTSIFTKTTIPNVQVEVIADNDGTYLLFFEKDKLSIIDIENFGKPVNNKKIMAISEFSNAKSSNVNTNISNVQFTDNKQVALSLAKEINAAANTQISWRLFFSEDKANEPQTVPVKTSENKFTFDKVAEKTIDGIPCGLVKLRAQGTTGYTVYYLQLIIENEGIHLIRPKKACVIRILKQLRGCKVLSFGNPKLVYDFLETDSKVLPPNRSTSTTEFFKNVLLNDLDHVTSKKIINWCAKEMDAPLTDKSFGITLNPSANYAEKKPSTLIKKVEKTTKTYTLDEKKSLIEKAIKKLVKEKEGNNNKYITIYAYDIFDNIKNADKIWGNSEDSAVKLYYFDHYKVDIPKYIRKDDIADPWSGSKYVNSISYIQKPCKEFDSLNLYIKNVLKCNPLKIDDVKREGVAGKRSTIFERYNTRLLAHKPELCKEIKQWCQKNKSANWKAEIEKKHYTYWGDRFNSYGEDRESEWDGYEETYIIIRLKTPTGKVKLEHEFHV